MVGFLHAEPETSPSVMRAHMSDVDDFTAVDLRDAKKAVAFLFQKNAPRFVWPPHFRIEVPDSRVVLRGHGRPFFIRVATVRIFSATGQRRRHLLIGRVWSKPLHLEQGWNQLRFFYRLPDRSTARFATRFIRVR
jgi:hypothetical protein